MKKRAEPEEPHKAAEKKISRKPSRKVSKETTEKLIRDLQVYQVELKMQNEELREAQEEIETSRSKYVDLYDFAPVGYFTLDAAGLIQRVNLTGAALLGVERGRLLGRRFLGFVFPEDANAFHDFRRRVLQAPGRQSGEIRLNGKLGNPVWAGVEGVAAEDPNGKPTWLWLALNDITPRKSAEAALRESERRLQELSAKLLDLQERERKVIANDIHDGLLSDLAAVSYSLESRIMGLKKATPLARDLREVLEIHRRTMMEARRIMNRLRPSVLDDLGLIPALEGLCREFQTLHPGIRLECKIRVGEDEIPDSVKVVIFRVAQEAMTNSARHGQAEAAKISLVKTPGGIEFLAQDKGRGFDLKNTQKGLGLESMRERVEISGGEFQIESRPGRGTTIRASWKPPN